MTKQILVQKKNVYGNELIYPACDDAVMFTKLTGKKTLDMRDISTIKALGYEIAIKQETL